MKSKRGPKCLFEFAAVVILSLLPAAGYGAEENQLFWSALEQEAVSLLSRYIRIDTTNPPGSEIEAAHFLKEIFDRVGIESRVIESVPGRGNIYARLHGNGARKAVLLLNHMDVVPADANLWKEPPFSGSVRDGYIWGRGALDMKGPAIIELVSMLALKRQKVPLAGDVIFLGTADEEAGGALGAGFMLKKHPELFTDVGLALNEGGGIRLGKNGKVQEYAVSISEKTPLWLRLTATGTPGHGSTPGDNLAVNKLIAGLNRLTQYQSPIRVVPEVQKFYADTAHLAPAGRQKQYQDLKTALQDPAFAAEFSSEPRNNASIRNTISITAIKGSDKVNVIPAESTAEIDVRLLPGEDPKSFMAELRKVIADDSIKIDVLLSFPPATSPPHAGAMKVITEFAKADGGAPVVSPLTRGFTDCRFFRDKSIPCFGFIPLRRPASDERLIHGIDERISIANLRSAVRAMYQMVRKLAAE